MIHQAKILSYTEDADAATTVMDEYDSFRSLYVNQACVAETTRWDRPSHEMIAHIPLLLHPDPKRALLIGFGIGFTTWTCRVHDVEVDVVELSPGVRRANRWFAQFNNDILTDPKVHLRIDDGRNYVLGTTQKYDVVQAGIIHPALSSGNASFYTVDFYRECKRILAPGGVMCQWLPLHGMGAEEFKMLIRSFVAEFPYTSVWYKNTYDFCTLIGTPEPLRIDFRSVEARVNRPEVKAHLARCDVVDVYDLLDSFCFADDAVRQAVGPGLVHNDDHSYVEFRCNRSFPRTAHPANIRLLERAREGVWPRLGNIPTERSGETQATLELWYEATEHLINAQYEAKLLQAFGPFHRDYEEHFAAMTAEFELVRRMNPGDRNADFIYRDAMATHEAAMARRSFNAGRRGEGLAHLARAAQIAPDSYAGAEAKYLCESVFKGPPR